MNLRMLKYMDKMGVRPLGGAIWGDTAPGLAVAKRGPTGRWRETGGQTADSARELHEECLSFVMPAQQGSSVAGAGDGN